MVDATDLKSVSLYREWGFESLPGHHVFLLSARFYKFLVVAFL